MRNHLDALKDVMTRLANINAEYFRNISDELPAMIIIVPRDKPRAPEDALVILPLEAIEQRETSRAIADALLTITCLQGCMLEQRIDEPMPDDPANHPDARSCFVYLAQAADGTRACGVQYILRPEHGKPSLAPLKVITGQSVAIVDSDLADMTRPGSRAPHGLH